MRGLCFRETRRFLVLFMCSTCTAYMRFDAILVLYERNIHIFFKQSKDKMNQLYLSKTGISSFYSDGKI